MVTRNVNVSMTLVIILFLKKTSFVCFARGTKFKIRRNSTCNMKNDIYVAYLKSAMINVLDLVSNGNND